MLGGAELQGAARQRFAQIQERAAELRQRFAEHVLDATDRFAATSARPELAGVPDDVRSRPARRSRAEGRAATG